MRASRWFIVLGIGALIAAGVGVRIAQYAYHRFVHPDIHTTGGCILVYEIDRASSPGPDSRDVLADALERRLRAALIDAKVRPAGTDRVEIRIRPPRGGSSDDLRRELAEAKELATLNGRLEFRIVANATDDADGIARARAYIDEGAHRDELDRAARQGEPPPPPPAEGEHTVVLPDGSRAFQTAKGTFTYSWAELGPEEQRSLNLGRYAERRLDSGVYWRTVAEHRNKTVPALGLGDGLLYSRDCQDRSLSEAARKNKGPEYFILLRNPERDPKTGRPKVIDRRHLRRVAGGMDRTLQPAVDFGLTEEGAELFYQLTSRNTPTGDEPLLVYRHLAIVLDGKVLTSPRLHEAIRENGQISGGFTTGRVQAIVTVLQGAPLPAVLKPVPVSETFIEPPAKQEAPRKPSVTADPDDG